MNDDIIDKAISILERVKTQSNYQKIKEYGSLFETASYGKSNEDKKHSVLSLVEFRRNLEALSEKVEQLFHRCSLLEKPNKNEEVQSTFTRSVLPRTKSAGDLTAHGMMKKIWDCLIIHDFKKIGVFGRRGIGKTTVMKYISHCLKENQSKFLEVIWVTLTEEPNIAKLRDDIARQLKLDLSDYKDEARKKDALYSALEKKKGYLLILDDMWKGFTLPQIGIPEPISENECKIVFTAREYNVCYIMQCDKTIEMNLLSDPEAQKLFFDHVGRDFLPTKELLITNVADKCACLPLAIVIVARSMAGVEDSDEWSNATEKLVSKSKAPVDEGNLEQVLLEQLQFGYDRLKSDELRDCLLYCALYPKEYEIPKRELIELLIDVGVIEEMETKRKQLDEDYCMLSELESLCFLEQVDGTLGNKEYVKMHNLVRHMVLRAASARAMVEAGLAMKKLPGEQKWSKDLMKVSLMENEIEELPSDASPNCPRLSVLLLQSNPLSSIPDSFFKHLHGLEVLNLSNTKIESLPESVFDLENLIALLLRHCSELSHVPSLRRTKRLRSLDLAHTSISELPEGLADLTDLRHLDLNVKDVEIPEGILKELLQLQYLATTGVVSIDELLKLEKLETFIGQFNDFESFNKFFEHRDVLGSPSHYKVAVGVVVPELDSTIFRNCVTIHDRNLRKNRDSYDDPLMLPKDVQVLNINYCSISSLCDIASFENVTNLCVLIIYHDSWGVGHHMEYLLSSSSCELSLQSLEILRISYLSKLRGLVRFPISGLLGSTFSCLKIFEIVECNKIKELFPFELMQYMQSLEEINVKYCDELVKLIGGRDNSNLTIPKLRVLRLHTLGKLTSICSTNNVTFKSLKSIKIDYCPKLKSTALQNFSTKVVDLEIR